MKGVAAVLLVTRGLDHSCWMEEDADEPYRRRAQDEPPPKQCSHPSYYIRRVPLGLLDFKDIEEDVRKVDMCQLLSCKVQYLEPIGSTEN